MVYKYHLPLAAPIWPAHSVLYLSVPTLFGELNLSSRMVVRWGYYYPYRVNMGEHT